MRYVKYFNYFCQQNKPIDISILMKRQRKPDEKG